MLSEIKGGKREAKGKRVSTRGAVNNVKGSREFQKQKGLRSVPRSPREVAGEPCKCGGRGDMKSGVGLYLVEEDRERARSQWRQLWRGSAIKGKRTLTWAP